MPTSNRDIAPPPEKITLLENNPQLVTLRKNGLVAFKDGTLFIGESYASNSSVISLIAYCRKSGIQIEKVVVPINEINEINAAGGAATLHVTNNSQAIQTFQEITRKAALAGASDIHIICSNNSTVIKQRIDGDLLSTPASLTAEDGTLLRSAIYTNLTSIAGRSFIPTQSQDAIIPSNKLPQDIQKDVTSVRVATSPINGGESAGLMVLRLLYKIGLEKTLYDLGFIADQVEIIEKRYSRGIRLMVGPTGSGKSTTIATVLKNLHQQCEGKRHILSVEDPPEFVPPGVNQIPVANMETTEDRTASFNGALRASLRLDPDVIFIGEIRDFVTADIAINAALTGHEVWATLHTDDALGVFPRLVLMGVDINLLAEPTRFRSACAQRLVKKLCPHCKIPFTKISEHPALHQELLESGIIDRLAPMIDDTHANTIHFKGNGCKTCNFQGTKGRKVIAEIFENKRRSKIMRLLIEQKWDEARTAWLADGGITMMMRAIEEIGLGNFDPRDVEDELDEIDYEGTKYAR